MRFRKRVGQGFPGSLGELGKVGTVTETVTNCTLLFQKKSPWAKIVTVSTRVRGTVTVSAVRL